MRVSLLSFLLLGQAASAAIVRQTATRAVLAGRAGRSAKSSVNAQPRAHPVAVATAQDAVIVDESGPLADAIDETNPLHVIISGAGVGGLALANCLAAQAEKGTPVHFTVLERTSEFKRFGGPIQLASNAMRSFREIDPGMYHTIESLATWTGNRTNGIKDGIRDEWYAKFDLKTPAEARQMPFTCVIDRPDLQNVLLERVQSSVRNSAAVASYSHDERGGVSVVLEDGETLRGDVLIGADGIWSSVRANMRNQPAKGEGSGVTYSGYTVFAGELEYSGMDPTSGYTVYIGPQQYFVITDIGKGRYQWYAFLARPANSEASEPKPEGASPYLQKLFTGWSEDIHSILRATKEHEIEQRDLYDRPPSVFQTWGDGRATLLGDAVHAMMPNLGQGGCQAIEDACVLSEELTRLDSRSKIGEALKRYRARRLARSAAVQGLSRLASDIIIQGFDTPAKITFKDGFKAENLNYNGIVTRLLQPILPIFFSIQFNFLYSGWRNEPLALEPIRDFFILSPVILSGGLLVDAVLGGELLEGFIGLANPQMEIFRDLFDAVVAFF